VEGRDDARTTRAKVTGQALTLDDALQPATPALLALLDAVPEDSPFLALDPSPRCQRTLDVLKRLLLRESQEQPLLLVCEELHWVDTETQALLNSLVDSLPTARLVLLVNYRPESRHGWGSSFSAWPRASTPPTSCWRRTTALWAILLASGEPATTRAQQEQRLRLIEPQRHRAHATLYSEHDPGVCCRMLAAQSLWLLRYLDQAVASIADGHELLPAAVRPLFRTA
jgi:hypothetical protein